MTHTLDHVYTCIDNVIDFAVDHLDLDQQDVAWARNRILEVFAIQSYTSTSDQCVAPHSQKAHKGQQDINKLLDALNCAALEAHLFQEHSQAVYDDMVMGILTAAPSTVQSHFKCIAQKDNAMNAMHWLYEYCTNNTYVKRDQLAKNPRFDSHGLTITINLAKPEFKNMNKAASGNSVQGGYPQCTICKENEGFAGRNKRTLRTIALQLGGHDWFWQFSPYGYFAQHGICVNAQHTPMVVNRTTFVNLLDFVDQFPGYFIGCNAALPRIGGSVLAHDHYQGGGELMPMHRAKALTTLSIPAYDDAIVEILDWPGTAIRVVSANRNSIIDLSDMIRQAWVDYDNPRLSIHSHDSEGNRQSALSPTVILSDRGYEMSLILRNNAVNNQYPDGIFHAHPQYYSIKQEPIGLIEAQGLFILPGRLVSQLQLLKQALLTGKRLDESIADFRLPWQELHEQLSDSLNCLSPQEANQLLDHAINEELGSICYRILNNTAVFKQKEDLLAFLTTLGFLQAH